MLRLIGMISRSAANFRQRSLVHRVRGNSLIRQDLLMSMTDTQARPIVSRHNLITLDSGNLPGGFREASYSLEAQSRRPSASALCRPSGCTHPIYADRR